MGATKKMSIIFKITSCTIFSLKNVHIFFVAPNLKSGTITFQLIITKDLSDKIFLRGTHSLLIISGSLPVFSTILHVPLLT